MNEEVRKLIQEAMEKIDKAMDCIDSDDLGKDDTFIELRTIYNKLTNMSE